MTDDAADAIAQYAKDLSVENARLRRENEQLGAQVRELLDIIERELHEEYAGKDG